MTKISFSCKIKPLKAFEKSEKAKAFNELNYNKNKKMRYTVSKKIMLEIIKEALDLAGLDEDIIENRADEYMDVIARDWSIDENDEDDEYYIINSNLYE